MKALSANPWMAREFPAAAAKLLQSCLTLCDPIDGSPPGSPVSGIFQARTLEWVAIAFSREFRRKALFFSVQEFHKILFNFLKEV